MSIRRISLGFVAASIIAACGGTGGTGDDPGAAGAGGAAGTAGKGGSSGTAGKAGTAGAAGTAGKGGSAGAGTGGATAGSGGSSGASAGKGGSAGASGSGGSAGTGAAGTAGAGGMQQVTTCSTSTDCAANTTNKICDPTTNTCVGCSPANDMCAKGTFCKATTKACTIGCKGNTDCAAPAAICDTTTNTCVQCATQKDCTAPGTICSKGMCSTGCDASTPCKTGECCGMACHDTTTDPTNCGGCGKLCSDPPNAKGECKASKCGLSMCQPGFTDCNQDPTDGCENDVAKDGACLCVPGATKPCYTGGAGTEGKGVCKGGVQTCAPSGTGYLPGCIGEVTPKPELCDGMDHDCDGTPNNPPDVDGDGWNACQGDCCEDTTQCGTPKGVNPGAYDLMDGTDNDCDGTPDNPLACSSAQKFAGVTPADAATAIELCQTTTAGAPLPTKKWGVLNSAWMITNNAGAFVPAGASLGNIQNFQGAIMTHYGTSGNNVPRKGPTFLGLSTGNMRDKGGPNYVVPVPGTGFTTTGNPPAVYTSAHGGGLLPGKCGGSTCPVGAGANDTIDLQLSIRVPTNAQSFSYDFRFFSGEYLNFQCTSFNDYFLALITTGAAGIPADHNISFDANGSAVSVNNGFFQVCAPKSTNCSSPACPAGNGDLANTGMDAVNGGGTVWLSTKAPAIAGETMGLDIVIFDVSDNIYDSVALVDNFQWSAVPSGPPTTTPAM